MIWMMEHHTWLSCSQAQVGSVKSSNQQLYGCLQTVCWISCHKQVPLLSRSDFHSLCHSSSHLIWFQMSTRTLFKENSIWNRLMHRCLKHLGLRDVHMESHSQTTSCKKMRQLKNKKNSRNSLTLRTTQQQSRLADLQARRHQRRKPRNSVK